MTAPEDARYRVSIIPTSDPKVFKLSIEGPNIHLYDTLQTNIGIQEIREIANRIVKEHRARLSVETPSDRGTSYIL